MPKKMTGTNTIPISDNLYTVLICAVRYSIGRRTYMPGLVTDWAMANLAGKIPRNTCEIIRRDIQEQREMGQRANFDALGDPCDVRTWEKFEQWLRGQMEREENDVC